MCNAGSTKISVITHFERARILFMQVTELKKKDISENKETSTELGQSNIKTKSVFYKLLAANTFFIILGIPEPIPE